MKLKSEWCKRHVIRYYEVGGFSKVEDEFYFKASTNKLTQIEHGQILLSSFLKVEVNLKIFI